MISVIVPIYKVEAYLCRCVDSILNQTYSDLEIILVDDGSPDGCPRICDEYARQDNRVRVIHKENGGLMSAWKAGFAEATGELIGFVDSDDWIDANMYESMLQVQKHSGAEIVAVSLIREFDNKSEREQVFLEGGLYSRERMEKEIFPRLISMGTMMDRLVSPNRVTKLFKAQLLRDNIGYCDNRISLGEDFITTMACICDAQSIYVMDDFFPYHYRIRGSSIMGSYNARFYEQAVLLNDALHRIAEEKQAYDFSKQLDNDLVSLAYYGIERNLTCHKIDRGEMISYIRNTITDRKFLTAFENETLHRGSKKCGVYRILIRQFGATSLYLFIRYVVLPKRRHFGY